LSDAGSGRVYVVYGRSTATAQNIQLKMLGAGGGVDGFEVYTLQSGFSLGETLASAGDFNGDGYGDLLFGGTGATPTYGPVGTYVLLGRAGMPARTDAGSLPAIVNDGSSDQLGFSVGGGADANGDGYDDIVIGAPSATVDGIGAAGRAWVIYGSRRPAFRVPVATLPATRGVRIDPEGHSDGLGMVTAMTGDLNGDGRGDVALGIPVASIFPRVSNGGGYVVFGRSAFTAPVDLQMLDGLNGFYVDGKAETRAGKTMAGAGDVDRDGFADLLIGAPSADVGANVDAGTVYLVRGRAVAALNRIGTEDGELMAGSPDNDTLDAAAGDDTLSARDGNDALIGGPGADKHYGGAGNDVIRFRDVAESPTLAASDLVFDFAPAADQIDVSPIDASVLAAGNNAFTFVGTAAFTGSAQLRYRQVDATGTANDYTIVEASTDADVTPELVVRLKGLMTLTSGNFVR
jgi:Ca2+-binding RTX toxin-like protein